MFLILFRNILCPQQMFPQFAQPKKHHGQQCVLVYQGLKMSDVKVFFPSHTGKITRPGESPGDLTFDVCPHPGVLFSLYEIPYGSYQGETLKEV